MYEDLLTLARNAALEAGVKFGRPAYLPRTIEEAATFVPHHWVMLALTAAYAQGASRVGDVPADPMRYDPATGEARPYPSSPAQWRAYHGPLAWMFNPWTGAQRFPGDIGTDPFGHAITNPASPLVAAARAPGRRARPDDDWAMAPPNRTSVQEATADTAGRAT